MANSKFKTFIDEGYTFKKDYLILGGAMLQGECIPETYIKVPLKTLNRHGLIAGATGTGKTKTMQVFAEQLSEKGIPCLLMDMKGDLSGLAQPGETNKHIDWRHGAIKLPYKPKAMPVEFLSISDEEGVKLRATVSEFGPVLLSKILDLNDTQGGIIALLFKYCDDNKLPLVDLKDLKKALQYITNEGKQDIKEQYGTVSSVSVNTIFRKIIELEQQGATRFFGERSFDVNDLLKTDKQGNGVLSILRLTDIQDKPKLFSTFMLALLAEVYSQFPEVGDLDKPKLCIFLDEAHLIFNEASDALLDQIEVIIKLIRSKGVGIYFVTQNPTDVPDSVLSQLGLKIQHALRAFTAKDRKNIKKTSENYPISLFYDTDKVLTELGIGEAFITSLNEKGIPTPLARTLLRAPLTRMDVLTNKELKEVVSNSALVEHYNEVIDRETAYELLTKKIEKAQTDKAQETLKKQNKQTRKASRKEASILEELSKNTMVRQLGRTAMREITRGLLGVLGVK